MSMFPNKQWSLGGLKKLIRKIDDTGTVDRRTAPGSGRPRTASVHRIIKSDLRLKCLKKHRAHELTRRPTSLQDVTVVANCSSISQPPCWTFVGSRTKRSSLLQLQVTPRTTACTLQLLFARKTSQLIVFSALGQRSASGSWCQLVCRHLDEQTFTSVIPAFKANGQYYRDILLTGRSSARY